MQAALPRRPVPAPRTAADQLRLVATSPETAKILGSGPSSASAPQTPGVKGPVSRHDAITRTPRRGRRSQDVVLPHVHIEAVHLAIEPPQDLVRLGERAAAGSLPGCPGCYQLRTSNRAPIGRVEVVRLQRRSYRMLGEILALTGSPARTAARGLGALGERVRHWPESDEVCDQHRSPEDAPIRAVLPRSRVSRRNPTHLGLGPLRTLAPRPLTPHPCCQPTGRCSR